MAELGTQFANGIQTAAPDWNQYLAWLKANGGAGAVPEQPAAMPAPAPEGPAAAAASMVTGAPAFGGPNVSGQVPLNRPAEPELGRGLGDKLAESWATRDQRQTFAVSPFYAASRLLRGETPIIDPDTGSFNPSAIPDIADAAGMAMVGGIGGAPKGGTVLGSGPVLRSGAAPEAPSMPPPRPPTTGDVIASSITEPRTTNTPRAMTPEELQRGALWQHTEQPAAREPILPGDYRASTRFPTAPGATENPLTHHLNIDTSAMATSPGFSHNVGLLSDYPGFARLKGMNDPEAAAAYIQQAKDNLQYLHQRSPQMMQERSPLWYEGAHEIADALANRWGVPRRSASGALAALSPQMDWFKNASLAERVGDIMTSAAAGRPMTPEMIDYSRLPKVTNEKTGFLRPGHANTETLQRIMGKSLDELTDPLDKALWIRMYDEAHNPRAYRSITPEGEFGDFIRNQGGEQADIGWGGLGSIQKAIRSLESGGDMDIISRMLGNKHKVRSFYNNIERPNDPRFGDVTADTHQVAGAQLRPLSGSSAAVEHNLASGTVPGRVGASSSDVSGVQGTYGLTADATRAMAAENNMLPRAAQSATWEPVRELFTDVWKRGKGNPEAVDAIWGAYDRGEITINQARDRIFDLAGGIGTPEWGRPGLRTSPANQSSTYR